MTAVRAMTLRVLASVSAAAGVAGAGLVAAVAAVALAGCHSCSPSESLAELQSIQGTASRDLASHPQGWMAAQPGATFAVGDGLRTDKQSTARLRLRHGGSLDVREETTIRFLASAPTADRRVSLETGVAELEVGDEGLEFETRAGTARIERGARVRLTAEGETTRLEVIVGTAIVESEGAVPGRLQPGQEVTFGAADAGQTPPVGAADASSLPDASGETAPAPPDDPTAITVRIDSAGVQKAKNRTARLEPVAPGTARLDPGSRLVIPGGAKILVRRGDESATVFGPSDVRVGTPGGALIEARTGRMAVEGARTTIRVDVPGGTITVRGTTADPASADLVVGEHGTDVFAHAGATELRGKRGVVTLAAHQAARLDDTGLAEAAAAAPVGPPQFGVPAGESATVHTLALPMPVRLDVGSACGGGAYAEVSRGGRYLPAGAADVDPGSIVLNLGEGVQSYRVRCRDGGASAGAGTFRVVRDAGIARLPKSAAHDLLHADGRKYSVLYQNILPALTVDWPDAPQGESFVLKLRTGKDHVDDTPTAAPSVSFPSGKLAEGAYGFWFETARDAKVRSPETVVRIVFDNATPAAEIHAPADGFDAKSGSVEVSGVAVEGVVVSVGQTPIPLDAQYRFKGEVPVAPGDRSIAIKIAHPTRGVQYYLRRVGGS